MVEMSELTDRLTKLEDWRRDVDGDRAASAERQSHINRRFDQLDSSIKGINAMVQKVAFLVLAAIVAGVAQFFLKV